jgi:hypothetical protein
MSNNTPSNTPSNNYNNIYNKLKGNKRNNRNIFNKKATAEDFLLKLLTLQNQLKLFHLQTNSYAQHKASDMFVDKISGIIDNILESYQGIYGKIYLKKEKGIYLQNMRDDQVVDFLKQTKIYFKDICPQIFDKEDTELFNIMDEISALIDKTLYLFELK